MRVTLLLAAPGAPRSITVRACVELANADLIFGTAEQLAAIATTRRRGARCLPLSFVDGAVDLVALAGSLPALAPKQGSRVVLLIPGEEEGAQIAAVFDQFMSVDMELEMIPAVGSLAPSSPTGPLQLPRIGALVNCEVIVTRPRRQSNRLEELLIREGARPIALPVIETVTSGPFRAALEERLQRSPPDWVVLTSQRAVEELLAQPNGISWLRAARVAVVGRATQGVLSAAGITVDFVPVGESASALASDLPGHAGERACFLAGARAGQDIEEGLTRRGFYVERIDVYDTVRTAPDVWSLRRASAADAVIFTSSSTVEATVALLGRAVMPPLLLSIGAKTTMTAQRLGLTEIRESARPRLDSLVELLVEMVAVRGVANR